MKHKNKFLTENYIPIILCAGFGTRLQPLTHLIPKVACPILNKSFAFRNIETFLKLGFKKVYCNVHYLPEIIISEIQKSLEIFGYDKSCVEFFFEEQILETGGGILRIYHELSLRNKKNQFKDCIVFSGDIVAHESILERLIEEWEKLQKTTEKNCYDALMSSLKLTEDRKDVLWVSDNREEVTGFGEKDFSEAKQKNWQPRLFSNHQILSHRNFSNLMKNDTELQIPKESSISLFYKNIIFSGQKIKHIDYSENYYWFNVGTHNEYIDCLIFFCKENKIEFPPINHMNFDSQSVINNLEKAIQSLKKLGKFLNSVDKNSVILQLNTTKNKNTEKPIYIDFLDIFNTINSISLKSVHNECRQSKFYIIY